jgi:hypothetical protein
MHKGRPQGVCNCPFKSGKGVCRCSLDGKTCKVAYDGQVFFCRGWLRNGKPSPFQLSVVRQNKLF